MVSTFYTGSHSDRIFSVPAAPPPAGPCFLTANGSRDSHAITLSDGETQNRSPRAGMPYGTISWGDIRRLIDIPARVEKNDAPFVILSTYAECDGRTHEVQWQKGQYGGLAVDIDAGNPSIVNVIEAVQVVIGDAAFHVYSSASASQENRKWRVLIPVSRPMPGCDYEDTQQAIFDLLKEHGLTCDETLARCGQPIFLPNVPPKRRGSHGYPLFYESWHVDGPLLDLDDQSVIVQARNVLRANRAAQEAETAARVEQAKEKRAARVQATGIDFNVVEHFNEAHALAEMFARYKFVKNPKGKKNEYRSPLSESKSWSTQDRGTHWVAVSGWAKKHNVGRPTRKGYRCGTAFDLFVHFEHQGSRAAAIRAYAAELGVESNGTDLVEVAVIEKMPDRGEARDLADWRLEMQVERSLALRQPGFHLDRSQTGSGKTFATIQEIIRATKTTSDEAAATGEDIRPITRTLTALPDHANIRERVREMQAGGLDAAAYPEMSPETCGNHERVKQAQSLGLVAGAAVCWSCPLKTSCRYMKEMKAAKQATHRVCTHERLRLSSDAVTDEVDVIIIDETPEPVVAPSVTVRVDDLAPVVGLASTVRDGLLFRRGRVLETTSEEQVFAEGIIDAYETIVRAASEAQQAGAVDIPLPSVQGVPERWQATLLRWADEVEITTDLTDSRKRDRFQKSMRLLTMLVTGKIERLTLIVEQTSRHRKQADGTVERWNPLHHFVTGSWTTTLPSVPVLMLDATANVDDLRARLGCDVTDRTPAGHLPLLQTVTQVPWDVSKGAAASTAAGLVEAFLMSHPEVQRLGLIGHQGHVRAMMTDDTVLAPSLRERIAKHCYFGQGPDRASNDWHDVCDHLLVVGTPRPGGTPVRERLVLTGKAEAAAMPGGDWGPRHWEAVTIEGKTVTIEGKGYRDPDWHAAHVSITRAALQQAVGRGRAVTGNGKPTTVISDEPLGVPVDARLEPVTPIVRETVEAVHRVVSGGAGSALFPIESSYREKFVSGVGVRVGVVIEVMRADAANRGEKLGHRQAQKRLQLARQAGRLEVPRRGWVVPVGDQPAAVVSGPAPALVGPTRPATVIRATGPSERAVEADVVAAAPLEVTTLVTTADVQPVAAAGITDIVEQIDERAAIMAEGSGIDDDTATLLAQEVVMGRGVAEPVSPAESVGVDYLALAARMHPLVDHAAQKFGGTVRLISEADDPFTTGGRSQKPKPQKGRCGCGHDRWVDVPCHYGKSVRRDCAKCGKYLDHVIWYGKPDPAYAIGSPPPRPEAVPEERGRVANRLSFLAPAAESPLVPATG
jgi:hypothetical protein